MARGDAGIAGRIARPEQTHRSANAPRPSANASPILGVTGPSAVFDRAVFGALGAVVPLRLRHAILAVFLGGKQSLTLARSEHGPIALLLIGDIAIADGTG